MTVLSVEKNTDDSVYLRDDIEWGPLKDVSKQASLTILTMGNVEHV